MKLSRSSLARFALATLAVTSGVLLGRLLGERGTVHVFDQPAPARDVVHQDSPVGHQRDDAPSSAPSVATPSPRERPTLPELAVESSYIPEPLWPVRNALIKAISRSMHERGVNPYACDPTGELVGKFRVDFRFQVRSSEDEARSDRIQFVRVYDGSPLPPAIVECLEDVFGGPYIIRREPDAPAFPDRYDGVIPVSYRIEFGAG
jgi:hypothetical protein